MCFGLKKFHTYLYRQACYLYKMTTNPLEMIQQQPIHTAPPHLQYMLLCMQKYDYTIQYLPSKDSGTNQPPKSFPLFPSHKESLPITIHQNIQHIQLSTEKLDAMKGAIECSPVYSTLYCLTLGGWPNHLKQVLRITQ